MPPETETVEKIDAPDSEKDQVTVEPTNAELLAKPELRALVDKELEEATTRAEQRGHDKAQAESRRKFRDPELVARGLADLAKEAADNGGEITRSITDRAQNIVSTAVSAVSDQIAEEIPTHFFANYELSATVLSKYHASMATGNFDDALTTLVTGAVQAEVSKAEADIDKRIEDAVNERIKSEDKANETGDSTPPPTPRGGQARGGLMLTSAELAHDPLQKAFRALSLEQREQIYARVEEADKLHGEGTVRAGVVDMLAAGRD